MNGSKLQVANLSRVLDQRTVPWFKIYGVFLHGFVSLSRAENDDAETLQPRRFCIFPIFLPKESVEANNLSASEYSEMKINTRFLNYCTTVSKHYTFHFNIPHTQSFEFSTQITFAHLVFDSLSLNSNSHWFMFRFTTVAKQPDSVNLQKH